MGEEKRLPCKLAGQTLLCVSVKFPKDKCILYAADPFLIASWRYKNAVM